MAQFYQSPNPTNDPNYNGASKEPDKITADTSLGQLFSGIGDMGNLAGKALKTGFEERIKDDAHKLIDPIMDQHGVGLDEETVRTIAGTGAKGRLKANQLRGAGAFDPTETDGTIPSSFADTATDQGDDTAGGIFQINDAPRELPVGAGREISKLDRMTQAYRAGNLSDSYYNAQLVSVAKELRARYPGFRDEVDGAISNITGIQPANALRRSLLGDINANQAALLAGASNDQKWLEKNAGKINALGLDPTKTDLQTMKAAVAGWDGRKELLTRQQLEAEVNSPEAEAAMTGVIAQTVNTSITSISNRAGAGKPLVQLQQEAAEMTARGGGTPQEIQELSNNIRLAKAKVENELRLQLSAPIEGRKDGKSLMTLVKDGSNKMNSILQSQLAPYDALVNMVENKNFSALESVTNQARYADHQGVLALRKAFPQAALVGAVSELTKNNPTLGNALLNDPNSKIIPAWQRAIKDGNLTAIVAGSADTPAPTPSQAQKNYGTSVSGPIARATLNQYDKVLSKDANPANGAHIAKQFFTDQEYYNGMDDKGRLKVFMTMASPEKTAYVKELATKDPEVFVKYQQWVKYAGGDIFRRNSADLNRLIKDEGYNIVFDPQSGQFVDATKPSPDPTVTEARRVNAQFPIQSINNALMIMKPVVGDDPNAVLHALGIDPNAAKEPGLIKGMIDKLGDKINEWRTDNGLREIQQGVKKPGKVSMDDHEAPELRRTVAAAESGGDYNAVFGLGKNAKRDLSQNTVGEIMAMQKHYTDGGSPSSAVGKYQFLRKTLASLVKEGVVSAEDQFTPDIQETLFTALAKRRGLDDYTSGKIDEATFANNLAKEWAGLPTTNGMSFYQGDGLNKATATLPQVMAALRKLRTSG